MTGLERIKDFFIILLTEAREKDKRAKGTAHVAIDANIRLLERIVVFLSNSIKEGTLDMEKAKNEIKVLDEGVIKEIGRGKRENAVTFKIIELASELKAGCFKQIDPKLINPVYFSTRVYSLRAEGRVGEDIKPKSNVNGEKGIFLVRLTEKQMALEPKRWAKVTA